MVSLNRCLVQKQDMGLTLFWLQMYFWRKSRVPLGVVVAVAGDAPQACSLSDMRDFYANKLQSNAGFY